MLYDLPHWNYFRLLERDLEASFRYLHPCPEHFAAYSDHFAGIILMASTEVENCLRSFTIELSAPQSRSSSIDKLLRPVIDRFPKFATTTILLPRYSIRLKPWVQTNAQTAPDWWGNGYNKIKHDRMGHPNASTLEHALTSVAALFVVLLHYYRVKYGRECEIPSELGPHIFELDESHANAGRPGIYIDWTLPDEV